MYVLNVQANEAKTEKENAKAEAQTEKYKSLRSWFHLHLPPLYCLPPLLSKAETETESSQC